MKGHREMSGVQGGADEAKSLGARELFSHLSSHCNSVTLGSCLYSDLQQFHLQNVDPPSFSQQTWPLCAEVHLPVVY